MCELLRNVQNTAVQTDWSEIRGWIQLAVIVIGGYVGIQRLSYNQKQRKLENGFKMIDIYKQNLEDGVAETFASIQKSAENLALENPDADYDFEYESNNYRYCDLYKDNPPDGRSIDRLTETIDMICHSVLENTVDYKIIIYELWIELDTIHSWLKNDSDGSNNLLKMYPHIIKMHKKYAKKAKSLPKKSYFRI